LEEGGCINFDAIEEEDEDVKSEENNLPIKNIGGDIWEEGTYVLHAVQKSKFSRSERIHVLN
jgi:hypothetical protein